MKTFNEKDIITWSNRHNAKVGAKGYFAISITDLKNNIEAGKIYELDGISDKDAWCFTADPFRYGFFLPVDAVKENKTYRACRNVQELYELVFNCKCNNEDSFCIDELIGTVIHFKCKGLDMSYYECITGIIVYDNSDTDITVRIDGSNFELPGLFKSYEIEINGEWRPFGVLEE